MNKQDAWKRVKCPVCGKRCLRSGLKVHIIARAKEEVYDHYNFKKLDMPHQEYIEKNVKLVEKEMKVWDL